MFVIVFCPTKKWVSFLLVVESLERKKRRVQSCCVNKLGTLRRFEKARKEWRCTGWYYKFGDSWNQEYLSSQTLDRDWLPKFETGLNIIIGIVQKVYEWPICPFAKMIPLWVHHFDRRRGCSLLYFLNYAYNDIYPSLKFWWSVSSWR